MIRFRCPACQTALSAPPGAAGARLSCKSCGQALQVPTYHDDEARLRAEEEAAAAARRGARRGPSTAATICWIILLVVAGLALLGGLGSSLAGATDPVRQLRDLTAGLLTLGALYAIARAVDRLWG